MRLRANSLWESGLFRPLSQPARLVALAAAIAIGAFGVVVAAVSLLEGDAQFGLVPMFFAIYLGIAYGAILAADRLVQTIHRQVKGGLGP